MTTESARDLLSRLNHEYLEVHVKKEDLFWSVYMGTGGTREDFARAEARWNAYISDSARLDTVREALADLEGVNGDAELEDIRRGLEGWRALFSSNVIDSAESAGLWQQCIDGAAALFEERGHYAMSWIDGQGREQSGSLPSLLTAIRTAESESERKSAHDALLKLEAWVCDNGFLDMVKLRNQFAKSQGYDNYFAYKVQKTEHMSADQLFIILDDFEERTRERNQAGIAELQKARGDAAILAHNFSYFISGDVQRQMDPYFPFSQSLERWVRSFSRLNIDYSGAELTLDLLDRKGKYQNGFCHGPIPAFYDNGKWVPGKINFTSNARPSQVGSGYRGLNTFFHEGGHAAHFANVKMNSPCFSQEFAPTSMAYAETQSMFCDSILEDADWLTLYAQNLNGQSIPGELIRQFIESSQPYRAFTERSILVVPYFERALYALSEEDLTPDMVIALARETEKRILGLEVSPRPLLAIPHLLDNESACSYQGYLLAHMAVYQTRAWFVKNHHYICDNPKVGPLLAKHYWHPGNSKTHDETLRSFTGEGFSARYLAEVCTMSVEEAWEIQKAKIEDLSSRPAPREYPLHADISVVDGDRVLADNRESDEKMFKDFSAVILEEFMD